MNKISWELGGKAVMWKQVRLFDVIERYIFHKEKSRSDNPVVRKMAEKMCEVELWEMWELTQVLD